jgi:hypothetical protein
MEDPSLDINFRMSCFNHSTDALTIPSGTALLMVPQNLSTHEGQDIADWLLLLARKIRRQAEEKHEAEHGSKQAVPPSCRCSVEGCPNPTIFGEVTCPSHRGQTTKVPKAADWCEAKGCNNLREQEDRFCYLHRA